MALTNTELEKMYNLLSDRLAIIERKLENSVSIAQLNGVVLLLERNINQLLEAQATIENRLDTAEAKLEDLV